MSHGVGLQKKSGYFFSLLPFQGRFTIEQRLLLCWAASRGTQLRRSHQFFSTGVQMCPGVAVTGVCSSLASAVKHWWEGAGCVWPKGHVWLWLDMLLPPLALFVLPAISAKSSSNSGHLWWMIPLVSPLSDLAPYWRVLLTGILWDMPSQQAGCSVWHFSECCPAWWQNDGIIEQLYCLLVCNTRAVKGWVCTDCMSVKYLFNPKECKIKMVSTYTLNWFLSQWKTLKKNQITFCMNLNKKQIHFLQFTRVVSHISDVIHTLMFFLLLQ